MQDITKVKLVLIAFCMVPIAYGVGHAQGITAGIAQVDQEAFDAYIPVARAVQQQKKIMSHHKAKADDVFAKAGF
jgi:hypothetical protein